MFEVIYQDKKVKVEAIFDSATYIINGVKVPISETQQLVNNKS